MSLTDLLANPAFTGLAGVALGVVPTTIGAFLRERSERRSARLQLVAKLALEDHATFLKLDTSKYYPDGIPPLIAFLVHHGAAVAALEDGKLTVEEAIKIREASRLLAEKMSLTSMGSPGTPPPR